MYKPNADLVLSVVLEDDTKGKLFIKGIDSDVEENFLVAMVPIIAKTFQVLDKKELKNIKRVDYAGVIRTTYQDYLQEPAII